MEYIIDFSGICDAKSIHQTLARTLNFPDWYGHNLDALYDCLSEMGQLEVEVQNINDDNRYAALCVKVMRAAGVTLV